MTHSQACRPCAKRKVKCDLRKPCSNCERRRTDRCIYPEVSSDERIKRLEALVKRMGGDPSIEAAHEASLPAKIASSRAQIHDDKASAKRMSVGSTDPAIIEVDGQSSYLESRAWTGWTGDNDHGGNPRRHNWRHLLLLPKHPPAFSSVIEAGDNFSYDAIRPPADHASVCFRAFLDNVNPLTKIGFVEDFTNLHYKAINCQDDSISLDESLLVLTVYLAGVRSLTEQECFNLFDQSKPSLLVHYRTLVERLLAKIGLFNFRSIKIIQAVTLYMTASFEYLNTQSLWSLMGLTIRSAEMLGLHRDGSLLGLTPYETEMRRRLWWQLQHMDLFLAVKCGATSMTLMADWDVKPPLNIEDHDITVTTRSPPEQRKGLTAMSYCLFTYDAIEQQRRIFQSKNGRFALSWQANKDLTPALKESIVLQLEEGFNEKFLRFCDPIKPIELLLQLLARSLIAGFRLRVLHPIATDPDLEEISVQRRTELLEVSIQCLRYAVAMHSKTLKSFKWRIDCMFPWQAMLCVLVEASRVEDISKAEEIWDLLGDVYANNQNLYDLLADRRRYHAAELVIAAWKTCEKTSSRQRLTEIPPFVANLENELTRIRGKPIETVGDAVLDKPEVQAEPTPVLGDIPTQEDFTAVFDLDFQDIDWSFWDTTD